MGNMTHDAAVAADNNKPDDPMDGLDNVGSEVTPRKKKKVQIRIHTK